MAGDKGDPADNDTGQLDALLAELPDPETDGDATADGDEPGDGDATADGGGPDDGELDGAVNDVLEMLEREPDGPEAAARASGAPRGKSAGAGAYLRLDDTGHGTDDETYIPPPAVAESQTDLDETAARVVRGHNMRLESASDAATAASDAPSVAADARAAAPTTAARALEPVALEPDPVLPRSGAGASRLWMAIAATAFVALAVVLYTQTDLFFPERRRAKQEAAQRAHEARQREIDAARVRTGQISVDSTPGEAAVWLSLGRTPAETMALPASVVHQIRVEHEGFSTRDINVTEAAWTGTGADQSATVSVELELARGRRARRVAPPAPPAPASARTGRDGRGVVRVESQPSGAQAYLLVGFTPDMTLGGVQAGLGYELKVVKDGHSPAFVVVRPDDWAVDDSPTELATSVSVTAELVPLEK